MWMMNERWCEWWMRDDVTDEWEMNERWCDWWMKDDVTDEWNMMWLMNERWMRDDVTDEWNMMWLMNEIWCDWWMKDDVADDVTTPEYSSKCDHNKKNIAQKYNLSFNLFTTNICKDILSNCRTKCFASRLPPISGDPQNNSGSNYKHFIF